MTNKEAIEALKKLKIGIEFINSFISAEDKDLVDLEAIDVAIKALERQVINDEDNANREKKWGGKRV